MEYADDVDAVRKDAIEDQERKPPEEHPANKTANQPAVPRAEFDLSEEIV